MSGDGRPEEDWGFYPDLARMPSAGGDQRRHGPFTKSKRAVGKSGQHPYGGRGRSDRQGPQGAGPGVSERGRVTAIAVLFVAALVILITGLALDHFGSSGNGDEIDWELLPQYQDAADPTTG